MTYSILRKAYLACEADPNCPLVARLIMARVICAHIDKSAYTVESHRDGGITQMQFFGD